MPGVGIVSFGRFVPGDPVPNSYFYGPLGLDTSEQWIVERTHIRTRHFVEPGTSTTMLARPAVSRALVAARWPTESVDRIVCATVTPQSHYGTASPDPPGLEPIKPVMAIDEEVGTNLTALLDMKRAIPLDVRAGCSGFVYALRLADAMIRNGDAGRVVVVGVDRMSSILNWTDRNTCILFGDAAFALCLEASEDDCFRPEWFNLASDGSLGHMITIPDGTVHMKGNSVFKWVVKTVPPFIEESLAKAGLTANDIDRVFPHQANGRMIEETFVRSVYPLRKVIVNVGRYSNTTAASVGMAIDTAVRSRELLPGMLGHIIAFGAGVTKGSAFCRWPDPAPRFLD